MAAAGDNTITTALRPRKLGTAFLFDAAPRSKSAVQEVDPGYSFGGTSFGAQAKPS